MPTGNHCLFGLKVPIRFSDRVPGARFQLFGDQMEGKEMGTTVLRHFGVKAGWVLARERQAGSGKFIDQRWRDLSTFKDYWGGPIG